MINGRAGNDIRQTGCFGDASVCGTQNTISRTRAASAFCDSTVGRLGGSLFQSEPGDDGLHFKSSDLHRTVCSGFGEVTPSMVDDGLLRAQHAGVDFSPASSGPKAFLSSCQPVMGFSKSCISSRFRFPGRPDESDRKSEAPQGATRRRRRSAKKTQEAKTKRSAEKQRGGSIRRLVASSSTHYSLSDQPPRMSMGVCSPSAEPEVFRRNVNSGSSDFLCDNELPDLNRECTFDPIQLGAMFCNSFLKCRTGLSQFIKLSLNDSFACNVQGSPKRPPIWPVPPPRWRWSASSGLGVKRRKQLRYHRTRHRLLQLIICSLNWEVLGHKLVPPRHAMIGASISSQQHDVICRLEKFVDHFLHGDSFLPSDLGRASEKFQDVIQAVKGFPQSCDDVTDEEISNLRSQLQSQFDPYSSHFGRNDFHTKQSAYRAEQEHPFCPPAAQNAGRNLSAGSRPVVASRVKWDYPPSFEASPFLSNGVVRAAYEDPEVLRKNCY